MRLVHFGAELTCPTEWENYDCSPTFAFERIPVIGKLYSRNPVRFPSNLKWGNIVRGLPVPTHSADGVYCSHVLEHLALEDLRTALRKVKAMTKPDGVFRMVLPDMEFYIQQYIRDSTDRAIENFMRATMLGELNRWRGPSGLLQHALATSKHRWMWDYKGLSKELVDAGFRSVRRAMLGDCEDAVLRPYFALVESPGRWLNALGVQCRA